MNTELVICYAGEPITWLDEIPDPIAVTLYDTGQRHSKHGAEAMAERRLGYSLNAWRQPSPMAHHRLPPPWQNSSRLPTMAANAIQSLPETLRLLTMVKETAGILLEGLPSAKPRRNVKMISATNDHHLRESAHWLRHIIQRFDSLADVTVFSHGWPFDHIADMVEWVRNAHALVPDWTLLPPSNHPRPILEPDILWQVEKILRFLGNPADAAEIVWVSGTQFAASRGVLRAPGLAFWEDLLALSESLGPRSAEALERTYHAILSHAAQCEAKAAA